MTSSAVEDLIWISSLALIGGGDSSDLPIGIIRARGMIAGAS